MYMLINRSTIKVEHEIEANDGYNAVDIAESLCGADWRDTHTLVTEGGLNITREKV